MQAEDPIFSRRNWRFEAFEERLALSAEPIADFWIDPAGVDDAANDTIEHLAGQTIPLGAEGHGWTDIANARQQFGLRGGRQTVAVVDSGIAYDHVALGGGLGKAYRVVGGWDFAENDANPYDDGPAGYHGTHVSGIVGANDSRYPGVAPDVDLVALRVFDDSGNGYFNWVEQALGWIHQHRFDFENPITTVNLSLGTEWNANKLPQWATLEDELKTLADDGIFISVAAGNSFMSYNAAGLSYPAVSQHVTAVASVDAAGKLSRFSQRADRVLAAPGERIQSTLPDHFYGGDGIKNDWGATSGTSMAAPYVAGSAVLVREAMQNLGMSGITQSSIYQSLRNSADVVFDSITNASYRRVNLQRTLETLVGVDDYGSSINDAKLLGSLGGSISISGTIGSVTDKDFFRFTAAQTGTASLTLQSPTHLAAAWDATSAPGKLSGNTLSISVIAGQTYTVGIAGGGATIGKYSATMQLQAASGGTGGSTGETGGSGSSGGTPQSVNWGTIEQARFNNLNLRTADTWYQLIAARSGTLTVDASFNHSRGNVDLEIYDSQQRLLAASSGTSGSERIDIGASAGGTFYVRARGINSDVDLRVTNLLSTSGTVINVAGTAAGDTFQWHGDAKQVIVNGISYSTSAATSIHFDGRGGSDSIILVGASAAETVTLRTGSAELSGGGMHLTAQNVENSNAIGGAGDVAWLHGSAGDDRLNATPTSARLSGSGFDQRADGFSAVVAIAGGGNDLARLYDSSGNDTLYANPATAILRGNGFSNEARGFAAVEAFATAGGINTAMLGDSLGSDYLDAGPTSVWLRGDGFSITANGFQDLTINSGSGAADFARIVGSAGDDTLVVWADSRHFYGGGSVIRTDGFENVHFTGGGGNDAVDFFTTGRKNSLGGSATSGWTSSQGFATEFAEIESLLARVRTKHKLDTHFGALDYVFHRIGRT